MVLLHNEDLSEEPYGRLVRRLKQLRRSRHFYHAVVPDPTWELGTYQVDSRLYVDGDATLSGTRETDVFQLMALTTREDRSSVWVSNAGPDAVEAEILEVGGPERPEREIVDIPAHSEIRFATSARRFLTYCGGRAVIPLSRNSPLYLRDQRIAAKRASCGGMVLWPPEGETALSLSSTEEATWAKLAYPSPEDGDNESFISNDLAIELEW